MENTSGASAKQKRLKAVSDETGDVDNETPQESNLGGGVLDQSTEIEPLSLVCLSFYLYFSAL